MQPQTRRSLDGLLVIGPHRLDAQLQALIAYARRTEHVLEVVWAILPGEDPASDAPNSGFPIVAFDDEIAGFTAEEYDPPGDADTHGEAATDWHVAHARPQPKIATAHLPVYGVPGDGEMAADAILCIGRESLDLQVARMEAYALRSALRIRGVYVASGPDNARVLLGDFRDSNRLYGAGVILTIDPWGSVELHT